MTTTPRIPPIPPAEWGDAEREAYAVMDSEATKALGAASNMTMVLANHPKLSKAFYTFGRHLLLDSTLPPRPRELITLRIALRTKSEYEWYHHVRFGKQIGITDEEIEAVRQGADATIWSDEDRAVLRLADELLDTSKVEDATWRELNRFLDRHQLMDLVFTIGHYRMLAGAISAFGVEIEPGFDSSEHPLA
jgi:alkylhydroperoxidase family enzyme